MFGRICGWITATLALTIPSATPAFAQVYAKLIVQGLSSPVGFAQDPADPTVQVIVEQGGRVRVIKNGILQGQDFLNLSGAIVSGGEQGLLGLAFAPDYATSGRVFVAFTNQSGNIVVSRFKRSAGSPLVADPATRFDFVWPGGQAFIPHPFSNHNGGNLMFGADGDLYIGMGDGGAGDDPFVNAQNPTSLLGKMLRLDVSVPDGDPQGYNVPADNPFVAQSGVLGEIWAFGLRNPWRWSFDLPSLGGTGAMVIGDVGQGSWEEIDYEPFGAGGRNYGWRNREGAHDHLTNPGPFSEPLRDPIFEYSHGVGHAIIGGAVYRGGLLGAAYQGRYFFGDVDGRVWSIGLTINPQTGEATASGLTEHTSTLGVAAQFPSGFGVDAAGELYILNYPSGRLYKISPTPSAQVLMHVDTPAGGPVTLPFVVNGWAIDTAAPSGTGVSQVDVWAVPSVGAPTFLGSSYGAARSDVAASYGQRFLLSGFSIQVNSLPHASYQIVASAYSTVTHTFAASDAVAVDFLNPAVLKVESLAAGTAGHGKLVVSGYAVDLSAASGTGVDTVHVWAYPSAGAPQFLGAAAYGAARTDVATLYGVNFLGSGWTKTATLAPGTWTIVAFLHSTITGTFRTSQAFTIHQATAPAIKAGPFTNRGAIDSVGFEGANPESPPR